MVDIPEKVREDWIDKHTKKPEKKENLPETEWNKQIRRRALEYSAKKLKECVA